MSAVEAALLDLGGAIEYPPTPDFVAPPERRRLAVWWAVAAVVLVLALVTTLVPAVRDRVIAWLGIRGVTIERSEAIGPVEQLPPGTMIGDPVALDDPTLPLTPLLAAALGDPAGVFVDDVGRVTLLYDDDGRTLLLTQFVGDLEPAILKQVGVETEVEPAMVNGEPAIWIGDGPHAVFFIDRDGNVSEDRGRLAGSTLLWEVGEVTLRLEGAMSMERAVEIAESAVARSP